MTADASKIKRIAITTGGGDAPGLNAVIRAVVLSALKRGWHCVGIRDGYNGLLLPEQFEGCGLVPLTRESVRGIAALGGTILGTTSRGNPIRYPVHAADGTIEEVDRTDELVRAFHLHQIDALVAVGGDGSLGIAATLSRKGLRVVGVPATIDNDLEQTVITFGFDTAVSFATEAIDRLHTTADAHRRVMVVEVMGRYAGWIALSAGVSATADAILIPEIEYDLSSVARRIERCEAEGQKYAIVVVAEGARSKGGALSVVKPREHPKRVEPAGAGPAVIEGREHARQVLHRPPGSPPRSLHLLRRLRVPSKDEPTKGGRNGSASGRPMSVRQAPRQQVAGSMVLAARDGQPWRERKPWTTWTDAPRLRLAGRKTTRRSPMSTLNAARSSDVTKLQEATRQALAHCGSLEEAAQASVSLLYDTYRASLVLARLYVTIPYARLPDDNRKFVRQLAESKGVAANLRDETPVLSLLGTRGVLPAWNDRHKSQGHVGIPLVATSFIESIPMLARLLRELGAGLSWIDKQDIHEVERVLAGGMCSLFHVEDAKSAVDRIGRQIIPAQDFVRAHGVETVFGMGGGYVGGAFMSYILFSRESVSRPNAQRFVPVVNDFKAATTALVLKHRFCVAA